MSDIRIVSTEELTSHTKKESLWLLLEEKVYDVSKFIDEHPGGDEVLLAEAGKDATEPFEDIGHSDEAREILKGLLIGKLEEDGLDKLNARNRAKSTSFDPRVAAEKGHNAFLIPLAALVAYFAWRWYSTSA